MTATGARELLTLPKTVAAGFAIDGRFEGALRHGNGHINDTFAATYRCGSGRVRFIVQRINDRVFPDVPALMENVGRVTRHLRARLEREGVADPDRRALYLIQTHDGVDFHRDEAGGYWRAYQLIEGGATQDVSGTAARAFSVAKAFGEFASLLRDLPDPPLRATIPGFHDTPARLAVLERAASADRAGRAARARDALRFAQARAELAHALDRIRSQSQIPDRVAHNDTKINNVVVDDRSGEGICVLDLDTVMSGQILCDFGDLVRTAACRNAEDEPNPHKVAIDLDLFSAVTDGYLAGSGDLLHAAEVLGMVTAAKVLTFECGVRFLTDFLELDAYFKVHREGQNLDRARAQFALVASIERREDELLRRVHAAAEGARRRGA